MRQKRKDSRKALKEIKRKERAAKAEERAERKNAKTSIEKRAAMAESALETRSEKQIKNRARAKDLYGKVGFELMLEDGLCMMEDGLFSETWEFWDISFKSSDDADREVILEKYSQIWNSLSPNTGLQLNIMNIPIDKRQIGSRQFIQPSPDDKGGYIDELNSVLNDKLREGVSNLRRRRFFTISVAARDDVDARRKLATAASQVTGPLSQLKCSVRKLDGKERLELIHSQLCPDDPFDFDYSLCAETGKRSKDWTLPNAIDWMPDKSASWYFTSCKAGLGTGKYCQVLVVHPEGFGSDLDDSCISSLAELSFPINISMHVKAIDKAKALDMVGKKSAWNDKAIIEYQQKAFKKGFDMTLVPRELEYAKNEIDLVDARLRKGNQRLFYYTAVIYLWADTLDELRDRATQVVQTAQYESYTVTTLDYLQPEGMNTMLPIGMNHLDIQRTFTTAQLAIQAPFAAEECDDVGGLYFGQNKVTNNLVMLDRGRLPSPSGFICGKPGTGKSFSVKQNITQVYFTTCAPDDPRRNPSSPSYNPKIKAAEIFVLDVKASEYSPLIGGLGGDEYVFSSNSKERINLMDLSLNGQIVADKDPLLDQSEFVMALLSQASVNAENSLGGLTSTQNTLIDRCVRQVYESRFGNELDPGRLDTGDLAADKMPILEDLYECLKAQPEAADREIKELITFLEMFVKGSFSYFNAHSTDVFGNRLISFNVSKAGEKLRTFAMLVVVNLIRNRMFYNYERGVQTYVFIDEIQALFSNQWVVTYFEKFWSEGRQYNLIATGMTQNVERVLKDKVARYMVMNSDFILLHKQSPIELALAKDVLQLSKVQASYIDDTALPGEGLLKAGSVFVPIKGAWPQGKLFDLWNTKPDDIAMKKAKEILEAQNRA